MHTQSGISPRLAAGALLVGLVVFSADLARAVDRLIGLHSAQVMSQSMPWIGTEAGLFKKYDLDFRLVFIPSSPVATAATLNGDAEIGVTGAVGNVRAIVQGFKDLVFVGGIKNFLTHSILGKPEIKRPEDLRGKKIGVGRFGGNTHYFTIQALKRLGMGERLNFRPPELSGGEQQRVAIARALVLEPAMVLADEPTGELDSANGEIIMSLIRDLNREQGQTFVIVTHDPVIASQAGRILTMKDGRIEESASAPQLSS